MEAFTENNHEGASSWFPLLGYKSSNLSNFTVVKLTDERNLCLVHRTAKLRLYARKVAGDYQNSH